MDHVVSYFKNTKASESKYDEEFKANRFLNQHRNLEYQQKGHIPTYNYRDIKAVGNQDLMLPNIFEKQNLPAGSQTMPTSPKDNTRSDQKKGDYTSALSSENIKNSNSQMLASQYNKDTQQKLVGTIGAGQNRYIQQSQNTLQSINNLPSHKNQQNFGFRTNSVQPITGNLIKGTTFYNNLNKNINNFKREVQLNSPKLQQQQTQQNMYNMPLNPLNIVDANVNSKKFKYQQLYGQSIDIAHSSMNTTIKKQHDTVSEMKELVQQSHVRVDDAVGIEAVDELNDLFDEIQQQKSSGGPFTNKFRIDVNDVDIDGKTLGLPIDATKGITESAYSGFSGLDRRSDQAVLRDQYGHIMSGNRGIIEQWDEENDDQELYNMLNKQRGRRNQLIKQPSNSNVNLLTINYNDYNRDGRQSRNKSRMRNRDENHTENEGAQNFRSQQTQDLELYVDKLNF